MICRVCGHSENDKPRSVNQLKLYWQMLRLVSDYAEEPAFQGRDGPENLHETLKIAIGYVKPIYDLEGNIKGYKADSISFNKMDSEKFNSFFNKAQDFIFEKILPNVERDSFEREIYQLLGIPSLSDYGR